METTNLDLRFASAISDEILKRWVMRWSVFGNAANVASSDQRRRRSEIRIGGEKEEKKGKRKYSQLSQHIRQFVKGARYTRSINISSPSAALSGSDRKKG